MSTVLAYVPALLWAALLLGVGSVSGVPRIETELPLDKLAHLLLYGALGGLAAGGWLRRRRPPAAVVIAIGLCVGLADEINQSRVSGRSAEVADWIMDAVGVSGAFALRTRLARPRKQEQERGQ